MWTYVPWRGKLHRTSRERLQALSQESERDVTSPSGESAGQSSGAVVRWRGAVKVRLPRLTASTMTCSGFSWRPKGVMAASVAWRA